MKKKQKPEFRGLAPNKKYWVATIRHHGSPDDVGKELNQLKLCEVEDSFHSDNEKVSIDWITCNYTWGMVLHGLVSKKVFVGSGEVSEFAISEDAELAKKKAEEERRRIDSEMEEDWKDLS